MAVGPFRYRCGHAAPVEETGLKLLLYDLVAVPVLNNRDKDHFALRIIGHGTPLLASGGAGGDRGPLVLREDIPKQGRSD
ncbi:MAG: hypothetical protein ACOC0U_04955 [Desulfovibrionales bacterium]